MPSKKAVTSCVGVGCGAILLLGVMAALLLLFVPRVRLPVREWACSLGHAASCDAAAERTHADVDEHARREERTDACSRGLEAACREVLEGTVFRDTVTADMADPLERICGDERLRKYGRMSIGGVACRRAGMERAEDPARAARLLEAGCRQGDAVSCFEAGKIADTAAARSFFEAGCATALQGGLTTADSAPLPLLLSAAAGGGFDLNGDAFATRARLDTRLHDIFAARSDRAIAIGFRSAHHSAVPLASIQEAADSASAAGGGPLRYVESVEEHLKAAEDCCTRVGRKPALVRLLSTWASRDIGVPGGPATPPRKIKHVDAVYPVIAHQARVQGTVILEYTIGADGRVGDVKVVRGVPLLDQAAVEAVRQWVYEPAVSGGVAVPATMAVTINFTLRNGAGAETAAGDPPGSPEKTRAPEAPPETGGGLPPPPPLE